MRLFLIFITLALILTGCGRGSGYACLGNDNTGVYIYSCNGNYSPLNDTQTIVLSSMNEALGTEPKVILTISSGLGSLNVSILSDGEPLAGVVNAGDPLTLTGTVLLTDQARTITVVIEPLAEGRAGRSRANDVVWDMELRPAP